MIPRKNLLSGYPAIWMSGIIFPSFLQFVNGNAAEPGQSRPNIIVCIADDLGWNDVGYHGSEIKTPVIDRMAAEGIEFNRFYVCSVSSPTRASLLTGRYPSRFGILTPLADEAGLPAGTVTLASLLKEQGYDTAISGKWHLGAVPGARPLNYGFSSSYGYFRGQIDPYTHLYKDGSRTWHRNDQLIDEEGHATDLITQEAIRFILKPREKGTPFFLYVAYSVPHYPLSEPAEWTGIYEKVIANESRRNNAASVTHMDNSIGRILEVLKKNGIEKNTIVMFLSDNGAQKSWSSKTEYNGKFKPHDVLGDNRPLRDWKTSLYEGALRVPATMIWPGRFQHMKLEEAVSVTDILPAMASLAGANIPGGLKLDGINFMYAIKGEKLRYERIMYWRSNNNTALKKGDWKLIHNGKDPGTGSDELYNISSDPNEKNDISGKYPDKVKELKEEIIHQLSLDKTGVVKEAK
jgi:arylsulfatase A-like enzyme